MANKYSEDLAIGCIALGLAIGIGAGITVAQLLHNDLLGTGIGILAGGISVPTLLKILG